MEKLLRASRIWWKFYTDREGRSFHEVVRRDTYKAIEQLTRGKSDLLMRIMLDKFDAALIQWAVEKMSENLEKHVSRGLERFFTRVMINDRRNRTFLKCVRNSPLYFPVRLGKELFFPFDRLEQLKRKYDTVLPKISSLKQKKWRSEAAYICGLMEALPGTSRTKAETSQFMKPSEIVYDYIARKYKLPLGIESIKKHLALKRIPQDLWETELKRLTTSNKKRLPTAVVNPVQ